MQTSTTAAEQGNEGDGSKGDSQHAGLDHRGEGLQGSSANEGSSLDVDFALGDFDAETEAFAEQVCLLALVTLCQLSSFQPFAGVERP